LTELTGHRYGPFQMFLSQLRLRKTGTMVRSTKVALRSTAPHAWIFIDYDNRVIGCRKFSPAVFAKIMRAADGSTVSMVDADGNLADNDGNLRACVTYRAAYRLGLRERARRRRAQNSRDSGYDPG
jgi:hypothetical protein